MIGRIRTYIERIVDPAPTIPQCVLPSFIIVGAMKSGTSSLFRILEQHPQVVGARRKEVHYFDLNYEKDLDWYCAHFPQRSEVPVGQIAGESSPYYLFHTYAPTRIARDVPNAKLIVLLRDPRDRAISHYFHEVRAGREDLPLDRALEAEEARLAPEYKKLEANEYYISLPHQHFSYKARGVYVDQLLTYRRHFPTDQVLTLSSERFFADPRAVLGEVFEFLGIDTAFTPQDLVARNVGGYRDELPAAIYDDLTAYFAPHNDRLLVECGLDFGWSG